MNKNTGFEIMRIVLAISISILITFAVIFFISEEPIVAIQKLLFAPVRSLRSFGNVIELMIPLMFTGTGMLILFSTKAFNLSADGAFHLGGLAAAIVAMKVSLPLGLHPVVAILFAGVVGAIIALIPLLIKYGTGANEFVVSLMLNYVCVLLAAFVVLYFYKDVSQGTFASHPFKETASLGTLLAGTRIHAGFIVALAVVFLAEIILNRTTLGYKIRVTGDNLEYAKYVGFKTVKIVLISQVIGGFICGIGGGIEVLGMYNRFTWQKSMNYGWDGVIISILAKNKPRYVPLAAFFLAYLRMGAYMMATTTDVQNEIIYVAEGVIIILIISENFLGKLKERMLYKSAKNKLKEETV